jgi:dTMP kinase
MTEMRCFKYPLPGFKKKSLPGKLIVLEGADGVGRSTQIALLREWLESEGYAVAATGMKRGQLAGKAIKLAMEGHTLGDTTMNLSYTTDFADRLEKDIIPALRAGFVVLIDRYIYSIIARAQVRGADPTWIRNVLGFGLIPDIVFYLQADINHLVPRVLNARGFSYWESGMDYIKGRDYYETYLEYQNNLLAQFDAMSEEFDFVRIDANDSILEVFRTLREEIKTVIKDMKVPKELRRDLKKQLKAEEIIRADLAVEAQKGEHIKEIEGSELASEEIVEPQAPPPTPDGKKSKKADAKKETAEDSKVETGDGNGNKTQKAEAVKEKPSPEGDGKK